MVLASRPDATLSAVVRESPNWHVVVPSLVSEERLPVFAAAYLEADAHPASDLEKVLALVRATCRTNDWTYAPILVRLAVKAHTATAGVQDVATVYEQAFESIVRTASLTGHEDYARLRGAAVEFALQTYWKHGERSGPVTWPDAVLSATVGRLRDAGILVGAAEAAAGSSQARRVRFFHDSMQSYFAAVGLAAIPTTDWAHTLVRAAGAPEFVRDRSDLFGYEGSELFCMLVDILGPRCTETLVSLLVSWSVAYDGALVRDAIAASLPPVVRTQHDAAVNVLGMSAGRYVTSVLEYVSGHANVRQQVAA
jgi:hypothetical protein